MPVCVPVWEHSRLSRVVPPHHDSDCDSPFLLVVQEQYGDALQLLEQLLQRQPGNYTALAHLLTLLRRVGRVEEGEAHLRTAQDHVSRTAGTAGRPVEDAPVVDARLPLQQPLQLLQCIAVVLLHNQQNRLDAPVRLSHHCANAY